MQQQHHLWKLITDTKKYQLFVLVTVTYLSFFVSQRVSLFSSEQFVVLGFVCFEFVLRNFAKRMKRKVVNTKKARLPESDRILLLTG
jgi:hypothetical protein